MLEEIGFTGIEVSEAFDTFGGAGGETNARAFDVSGYTFMAIKPG